MTSDLPFAASHRLANGARDAFKPQTIVKRDNAAGRQQWTESLKVGPDYFVAVVAVDEDQA